MQWLYGDGVSLLLCRSSSRIYIIDTITDPLKPSLHKVVEPEEILEKTGLAFPHTAHCLANGDIMVSCMGDKEGRAEGSGFLLLDSDFKVKGRFALSTHKPRNQLLTSTQVSN